MKLQIMIVTYCSNVNSANESVKENTSRKVHHEDLKVAGMKENTSRKVHREDLKIAEMKENTKRTGSP